MSDRRYACDPLVICRAALALGPLKPAIGGMRFKSRLFSYVTVSAIIAAGDAVRLADGRVVVAVSGAAS